MTLSNVLIQGDELWIDFSGSIETLAQAMNQLGGKSNSGEGGEDAKRYEAS